MYANNQQDNAFVWVKNPVYIEFYPIFAVQNLI